MKFDLHNRKNDFFSPTFETRTILRISQHRITTMCIYIIHKEQNFSKVHFSWKNRHLWNIFKFVSFFLNVRIRVLVFVNTVWDYRRSVLRIHVHNDDNNMNFWVLKIKQAQMLVNTQLGNEFSNTSEINQNF